MGLGGSTATGRPERYLNAYIMIFICTSFYYVVSVQVNIRVGKPDLLLAHKWEPGNDPTGWWMSEKLDGVRKLMAFDWLFVSKPYA